MSITIWNYVVVDNLNYIIINIYAMRILKHGSKELNVCTSYTLELKLSHKNICISWNQLTFTFCCFMSFLLCVVHATRWFQILTKTCAKVVTSTNFLKHDFITYALHIIYANYDLICNYDLITTSQYLGQSSIHKSFFWRHSKIS